MKIVFVHGIAQEHKDPDALHEQWDVALSKGLLISGAQLPAGVTTEFAYYGDVLFEKTGEIDAADAAGVLKRGESNEGSPEAIQFYAEFLTDVAKTKKVSTKNLATKSGEPIERGIQNWRFVLALARRLNQVGAIADWTIDTFTRDVWVYLRHFTVQIPVDKIVDKAIPTVEPCVVVSHSLGTVVAYNVLMAREARANVKAWLTLGSPLGISAVISRIPRHHSKVIPRSAPTGVGSWYSARDPDDIVALHPIPRDSFAGLPAVINANHVVNDTPNEHGIEGYLSDGKVAEFIARAAAA